MTVPRPDPRRRSGALTPASPGRTWRVDERGQVEILKPGLRRQGAA